MSLSCCYMQGCGELTLIPYSSASVSALTNSKMNRTPIIQHSRLATYHKRQRQKDEEDVGGAGHRGRKGKETGKARGGGGLA